MSAPTPGPSAGQDGPRLPAWAGQLDAKDFSWSSAIGGWRGAVESVLPALTFVVLFVITRDLRLCLIVSGGVAVLACAIRLAQHQALTQALSGLLGVAIGVVWAAWSGRGENYFAGGLVTAAFFTVTLLVSILVRRPLAGVALGWLWGLGDRRRTDPVLAPLRRRALAVTWMWTAMFALRLAIQWPLWHGGLVAELGVAKLVLGLPLFALVCWATWVALKPFSGLAHQDESEDQQ